MMWFRRLLMRTRRNPGGNEPTWFIVTRAVVLVVIYVGVMWVLITAVP